MREGAYVLATGQEAGDRLRLQHAAYGPYSEAFLTRAGLRPGMRVADIGCGTGEVSCWIARQVGASGSVVGVDASEAQVEQARGSAASEGLENLRFLAGRAEETGLPRESFDLVYCRLLLIHLAGPDEALREMRLLVRPGGVLACEDFEIDTAFCEPAAPAMEQFLALNGALAARRGIDWRLGRTLYRRFLDAGFREPEVAIAHPVLLRGDLRRLPALTLAEMAPALIAEGLIAAKAIDLLYGELLALAADERTMIAAPRMTQVWARR